MSAVDVLPRGPVIAPMPPPPPIAPPSLPAAASAPGTATAVDIASAGPLLCMVEEWHLDGLVDTGLALFAADHLKFSVLLHAVMQGHGASWVVADDRRRKAPSRRLEQWTPFGKPARRLTVRLACVRWSPTDTKPPPRMEWELRAAAGETCMMLLVEAVRLLQAVARSPADIPPAILHSLKVTGGAVRVNDLSSFFPLCTDWVPSAQKSDGSGVEFGASTSVLDTWALFGTPLTSRLGGAVDVTQAWDSVVLERDAAFTEGEQSHRHALSPTLCARASKLAVDRMARATPGSSPPYWYTAGTNGTSPGVFSAAFEKEVEFLRMTSEAIAAATATADPNDPLVTADSPLATILPAKASEALADVGLHAPSLVAESSFGDAWSGYIDANMRNQCAASVVDGRMLLGRPVALCTGPRGQAASSSPSPSFIFLGNRFSAPAEAISSASVAQLVAEAHRLSWPIGSPNVVLSRSAALFTLLATLARRAVHQPSVCLCSPEHLFAISLAPAPLYIWARHLLAGGEQLPTHARAQYRHCVLDSCVAGTIVQRACRAMLAAHGREEECATAAANGGLLCTQHPSCSTPQDADRCDDNLYRRAEALYAHIGDAFERQRPATWRASDVMMVPGATSVVDKPLAHSLFDVPNQGTWLVVSFPTVSSVGAMDIVATVAAINCIAGVRVAVMGVKIPLSNDGDGGDNAGRLGEDGPAARRLSLPPLPPFFYVQSAWLSAIKIASLLQGSCDAYTNNAAPAPLSDGYSNIRTKASSPWGHHTPSMYTKLSNSAAFAARLPSPFNAMCVTEAARVLTDAIPTCASASVTMMHTDDFSPALLSIGAVGSWLAFVMETLVQKDALVGRRPAYLKWFSRRTLLGRRKRASAVDRNNSTPSARTKRRGWRMPSASRISLLLVAIGVIAPTTDLVLAHLTHARSPIWNLLGLLACDRSVVGISVGTAAFVALRQFLTVDRLGNAYRNVVGSNDGEGGDEPSENDRRRRECFASLCSVVMSVTANGTTSLPPAITLNGASADKFVTGLLLLATWPLAKRSFAVTLLTALDVLDHGPMPVAAKNSSDNLARFFHKAASHSTSSKRPVPYYVVHALFAHLASRAIQATARSSSYGFGEVIFTAKSGYSILQTDFCHFLPVWPPVVASVQHAYDPGVCATIRNTFVPTAPPHLIAADVAAPFGGAPPGFVDCVAGLPVVSLAGQPWKPGVHGCLQRTGCRSLPVCPACMHGPDAH